MNKLKLKIAGEDIELLGERALFWPREKTMFIADLHFGKANTFQKFGVPLIDNTTNELQRLNLLLSFTDSRRVVFLGDFIHSKIGTTSELTDRLIDWIRKNRPVEFSLVKGNHDRGISDFIPTEYLRVIDNVLAIGPFECRHEPARNPDGYVLCGHLHPGIRLRERGGTSLRSACFWIQSNQTVLPAFGAFTGTKTISPKTEDRVVLIGDGSLKQIQ